jgi:hypothetical protein
MARHLLFALHCKILTKISEDDSQILDKKKTKTDMVEMGRKKLDCQGFKWKIISVDEIK